MKLNIQKFANTITTSFVESNLDPNTNTSTLKITIYFSPNNNTTYFSSEVLECTCNGVKQTKNVSLSKGGHVEKTFTFNNIQHEADGSKTVAWNWKCATGTSVLGTITRSGNRILTTLHTPPTINSISFVEVNPTLLNIGLTNDEFVLGLSQKQYTINAEYETGSTYDHLLITNEYGSKILIDTLFKYSTQEINVLNTNNDILDLSVVELKPYKDYTQTPIIDLLRLKYTLYDDKNGKAETQYSNYDYIQYTPLSINASTKRVGQTSGQVSISCNGNYFNKTIGNISQSSTYKPTIKYKYWKYGDSEPVNYTNIISPSDITTSAGSFSVSNLNIGSTTDTDTNYFDPRYSYRIKIQVSDNFTSIESLELSIAVGEAIWTEFETYVDFKKLTIQHKPIITIESYEKYTGATASGSNGSLTYDISKAGYEPIGIMGFNCDGTRASYISIFRSYVSGNDAYIDFKNTHPSSALANNDTSITIYIAYIRS